MAGQIRRRQATALDILLASSSDPPLELWLEYTDTDANRSGRQMVTASLYVWDCEQYHVTDWFPLPATRLTKFGPFAERRIGHLRVDDRPDEVRAALDGVSIPLAPVGTIQ